MAFPPTPILLAALAALATAPAATAEGEKAPPPKTAKTAAPPEDAGKDTVPGEASPPAGLIDYRLYPRGVTVLVEGWKSPVRARAYPEGVTVLGKRQRRAGRAEVIRLTVLSPESALPGISVDTPELPPADTYTDLDNPGEDLLREPAAAIREQRRRRRRRDPVGPSVTEQLDAFGRDPQSAGRPLDDSSVWRPNASFERRDPAHPYPWQPARFATPSIDPEWKPTDAWPDRREASPYPWNPATFSEMTFDPTWTPTDAWNRSVEIPVGIKRYTVAPPPGLGVDLPPAAAEREQGDQNKGPPADSASSRPAPRDREE